MSHQLKTVRWFLFTDIEDSTGHWERAGDRFRPALERHRDLVRERLAEHQGRELAEPGDGFLLAFEHAAAALNCAIEIQQALGKEPWHEIIGTSLAVRMGVHGGTVELKSGDDGEYRGLVLHRAARVCAAAHGGQVLCTHDAAQAADGSGFEMEPLGLFRLRGAASPEPLHQVCWPEMPQRTFPPPKTPPAFQPRIPAATARFFGRERELREICQALQPLVATPGNDEGLAPVVVTLTGAGGIGKTRLAVEAAQTLLAGYSHAIWWVDLADVPESTLIPERVRGALGLSSEDGRDPYDQINNHLFGQAALLILDNFEHLIDTGVATLSELLKRCPSLRLLVTSRKRLALPAEREIPIETLPTPASDDADALDLNPTVRLFVDRAQASRADFALTATNRSAVAEICRLLDGMPLALEIAAARASVSTATEIRDALQNHLDVFEDPRASSPHRHRSLGAAIEWSYGFLPPALQRFWINLSVFRGGWSAEAAAAVAMDEGLAEAAGHPLRALGELRGVALLVAAEERESMRFRMLEATRQFAEEKLEDSGGLSALRARHLDYFLRRAQTITEGRVVLQGSEWSSSMDRDVDNFRAALASSGPLADRLQLAVELCHHWRIRGAAAEGVAWFDRLFRSPGDLLPRQRAIAENAAGVLALDQKNLGSARLYLRSAFDYFEQTPESRVAAAILINLGLVHNIEGEFSAAKAVLLFSLERLAKEDTSFRTLALCNLGGVHIALNELDEARTILTECAALQEEARDLLGLTSTFHNLASCAVRRNDVSDARHYLDKCFALRRVLNNRSGLPEALLVAAELSGMEGNYKEAAANLWAAEHFRIESHSSGVTRAYEMRRDLIQQAIPADVRASTRDIEASGLKVVVSWSETK